MPKKLIILDRDGVINHDSPHYICSPEDWKPIEGSLSAIADLNRNGYQVTIASNQSGVGRGYYSLASLDQIHQTMKHQLREVGGHISGIFFCPHHPQDGCECRKPKPGLIRAIKKQYQTKAKDILFIGDSMRDIEAAEAGDCLPVLVRTGHGEKTLKEHPELKKRLPIFDNLAQAVQTIID